MQNYAETIMSQYANSPIIVALIEGINTMVDPTADLDNFYNMVMNLSTATGYGLDVWGRIVGIGRNVSVDLVDTDYFGFFEAEDFTPFNDAPFNGDGTDFASYPLYDELYRQLIIMKAYKNIIYATAPNINKFLSTIFPDQKSYYLITGTMSAKYIFEFTPTDFQRLVITELGILPVPCGVSVEYDITEVSTTFGFRGSNLQTFNNGTFRS